MRKLYNVDHQTAVIDQDQPGVQPGESYNFTDEQIEAGLTGSWSETDPKAGAGEEKKFKGRRRKPASDLADDADQGDPAADGAGAGETTDPPADAGSTEPDPADAGEQKEQAE